MRWATATALLGIAGALALAGGTPAVAGPPGVTWTADLSHGETAGIELDDAGVARIDPDTAFLAATEDAPPAAGTVLPTGLLTLEPHPLDAPTDRVVATVAGDVPDGTLATVDVRGKRAGGGWTEWIPAEPGVTQQSVAQQSVALPLATREVQARLVLAGDPAAGPAVREVTLTAHPAPPGRAESDAAAAALSYRIFATREGLVGGTTANGHVIRPRDHFVALPSRRALAPRGSSDYSVKVCAPTGRCAFAPVWDVGPWNTRDDYWNPPGRRQEWRDLPQGVPQAQAAHQNGYNGGRDQYDRRVANPAGIDLGDGMFWDALGLRNNAWVTVGYLWTGSQRLAALDRDADVRAAPDEDAAVVGIAAEGAAVPVECALDDGDDRWLRVGDRQYVAASAVPDPPEVATCTQPPTPAA